MPIIKSAIKRMHQAAKARSRNMTTKRDLKDAVKAFLAKPSATGLSKAQAQIDKAVKKNVLEKNTAARRKAHLASVAKEAGVKLGAAKKATSDKTTTVAKKPAVKKTTTKKAVK